MNLEAEQSRFTFLTVSLLVALGLLAITIIDNWPELRDSFPAAPAAPAAPSNPTGRH